MRALLTLIVGAFLLLIAAPGWAASDRRIALVIGNSAYRKFPQLPNPRNDAEDVTAALKRVGFTVLGGVDMSREQMRDSLRQFARSAQDAEAAMVFYAGHGLQYRGRNYLVPVDAKLEDEFDLEYETVRVDDVVEELNRADGPRILVLDACRNLPLAARNRDPFSSTGLAKLSGRGLIVAYATQANQVAYDGTGRNSIFTGAFIKSVQEPGLDVAQVFQRVSMNVDRATSGRQTPELSLSYPGQFYLNKGETEREAWPRARASNDPQALRDFIARYPNSFVVDDAKDLIQRLEARASVPGERSAPPPTQNDRGQAPTLQLARRPDDGAAARAREEAERIAWQRLQDEQKRRADARQQAERERLAAEEQDRLRIAQDEERRRAEARRAEAERQAEEARQKKLAEDRAAAEARERQRLEREARLEDERKRLEARKAEQDRVAEEARQKKLAEERSAAEARDRQRLEREARLEDERRQAELRKAEAERVAEETRQRKIAEERSAADARERQKAEREARAEEERRLAETRKAEQDRVAEEARQRKIAEERSAAEARERQRVEREARAEEEKRQAERVAEETRQRKLAEDRNAAEARERQRLEREARVEEEKRQAERVAEEARQRKLAEDRNAAEARERQRLEREARLEDERRQVEARRIEQERVAEEARARKLAEDREAADARERQRVAQEIARRENEARKADEEQRLRQAAAEKAERDRLAWQQLEDLQRRRASPAPTIVSPPTEPVQAQAGAAPDSGAQTTLDALKSGRSGSGSNALVSLNENNPQASDRPAPPMRLASNDATQPAVVAQPPQSAFPKDVLEQDQLIRATKAELGRIGCLDDEADAKWDKDARDALRKFGRQVKLTPVPTEPSQSLLEDLKGRPANVCPLECGSGERVQGDQCVAVARPERLDSKPAQRREPKPRAVAQERRAPAPEPRVVRPRPQPAPAQAPVATAAKPAAPRPVMGVGF